MRASYRKSTKTQAIFCILPIGKLFYYTASMDSLTTGLILTLCTILVYVIVQKWWRNRRAAKLADKLLADVIKGKDAFRR
jgi:hypothetical protein